jgi:hypothetical protein
MRGGRLNFDKLMVVGFLEWLLFKGMHTAQYMKRIAPYDYALPRFFQAYSSPLPVTFASPVRTLTRDATAPSTASSPLFAASLR